MTSHTVSGKCILVVEDDYLLAREVCNDLKEHGASVLGPAPTVHYAQLMLDKRHIDGAVLDISLFGEDVYRLVDNLLGRRIPVVFATAYDKPQIAERYRFIDTLHKPISLEKLREKIAQFRPLPEVADPEPFGKKPNERSTREGLVAHKRRPPAERWAAVLVRTMRNDAP